jgi:hypothetical protein
LFENYETSKNIHQFTQSEQVKMQELK